MEDALAVDPLLIHINIRRKNTLLRRSVPSIVPAEHVALPPQKEVEPVRICRRYHPLINQCIRITHDYRRLVEVLAPIHAVVIQGVQALRPVSRLK